MELSTLQKWMLQSIMHPGGVVAGAQAAAQSLALDQTAIAQLVRPSSKLSAAERLAIYHNAYMLRLLGVLEAEYPALKLALGEALFRHLAEFYLRENPSTTYTLFQLSAQFPDFLAATVPQADLADGWPNFIIDLVRLERTYQEVYRGPGMEGRPGPSKEELRSALALTDNKCKVKAAPCLRLMQSSYPIHQFLMAARKGHDMPPIEPEPSYLAICRLNYQIMIHRLEAEEYESLEALIQSGNLLLSSPSDLSNLEKWLDAGFFESFAPYLHTSR